MQAASSLIMIMAALTRRRPAGSQAPMFMILDKKEAGQRKQTQLKNKE
jgi:hypothetical protein